jgi:hypothetical protein
LAWVSHRTVNMHSTTIQVGQMTATLTRTGRSPHNDTKTWLVSGRGNASHHVTSSRIYNPSETLVFPTDEHGRVGNREVAGGPGLGHFDAVCQYLRTL